VSEISIDRLKRLVGRAQEIAKKSDKVSVQVAAEPLIEASDNFSAAEKEVKRIITVVGKETPESDQAMAELAQQFDEARTATLAKMPHAEVGGMASSFATADDLLNGVEELEDLLVIAGGVNSEHPLTEDYESVPEGQRWARRLLNVLVPVLEKAVKEHGEAVKAAEDLQKAKQARAESRAGLDFQFRAFRRVVRIALGSTSREYHPIRLRSTGGGSDDEPEETPPAAPATEETETSPAAPATEGSETLPE